jgi:hypothetical protein
MLSGFKALLLAGVVASSAQAAHAQLVPVQSLPGQSQADASSGRVRTAMQRVAARPTPEKANLDLPFRPIAATREDLTLRGESATSDRAVFLSANDALRASAFRVGFSNTVSNLPDASRLSVRINDQYVGDVALSATSDLGQAVFPVQPGLLVPGFNSVRFSVSQRHRVDCSINATYELWTQISPAHTGLVNIAPTPPLRGVSDLPMLAGLDEGRTPIRIRLPQGYDASALDQAMRAVNALVLGAAITQPVIEVSSEPGVGPGLDIVVGGGSAAAAGQRLAPELGLFVNREGDQSRTLVSILDTPEADLNLTIRRLEAFAARAERTGSKAGLRALANLLGRRIGNDSSLTFADLGMETRPFDGHLLQMNSRLMLPADFFPAPYGAARLTLDSAFAGQASLAQRISISVNDQVAAIVPIVNPGRGGLNGRTIELPLESFKPGANVITVEANLSDPKAACDATLGHSSGARLAIGPTSRISFDRLARAASYPNLSATLGHGFPYAEAGKPLMIGVSNQDPAFLDGAMTMVARMVAAAQAPIPTAFRFGMLDSAEPGIFFGSPAEAPDDPARLGPPVAQTRPQLIATANAGTLFAAASGGTTQTDATFAGAADGSQPSPPAADGLVATMRQALDLGSWMTAARQLASGDFSSVNGWLQNFGLLEKAPDQAAAQSFETTADSLVIRQTAQRPANVSTTQAFFDPETRPVVQTVVLGADPAQFAALVEKATSAHFWARFNGEAARVRLDDWGPVNLGVQQRLYSAIADASPGNIRLVAAGWLSLNPAYYLTILGALVALLALTTAIALRMRRV